MGCALLVSSICMRIKTGQGSASLVLKCNTINGLCAAFGLTRQKVSPFGNPTRAFALDPPLMAFAQCAIAARFIALRAVRSLGVVLLRYGILGFAQTHQRVSPFGKPPRAIALDPPLRAFAQCAIAARLIALRAVRSLGVVLLRYGILGFAQTHQRVSPFGNPTRAFALDPPLTRVVLLVSISSS